MFIHGALCYSYSGLCLFSSQTLGRSGNRGKCAYSCRDAFEVSRRPDTLRDGSAVRRDPGQGFPFSMKDLALPDHLPALAGRRRVVLQDRGPQEKPALRRHHHRLLSQAARRHDCADDDRPDRTKPTCKPCSAGRGRGCSCNRTRTRKSPTATRSAIAAPVSAKSKRFARRARATAPALPHQPGPGAARRLADRSAGAGQTVRLRRRQALGLCFRTRRSIRLRAGVRSSGGGAGRGRFAGRPSATAGRRSGVLLVVAGGEAALSAQPAQARALPRAPRRRHRGRAQRNDHDRYRARPARRDGEAPIEVRHVHQGPFVLGPGRRDHG